MRYCNLLIFKTAVVRHLETEILNSHTLPRHALHHCVKFCGDQSNCCIETVQLDNAKHSLALFLLELGVASDLFLEMQSQVGHVLATVLQLASQIRSLSTQLIVISHRFRQLYTQITFQQGNRSLRVAR